MSQDKKRSVVTASAVAAIGLIIGFAAAAFAISATQDDPGRFSRERNVTLQGVLFAEPYPHIRLAPSEDNPAGRTVTIASGNGKRGVVGLARRLDGQVVEARGFILQRGDGEMLQTTRRIAPVEDAAGVELTETVDLGRWRLAGEICDGQCVLGIMRPGRGLAHKACANLCVQGGVPPVFVTETPVEGSQFMLLANAEGGPLGPEMYDAMGAFIAVEGALERRGDLLVFKVDLATAEAL